MSKCSIRLFCLSALLTMGAIGVAVAGSSKQIAGISSWAQCSALQGVEIPVADIGLPTRGGIVTQAVLVPAGSSNLEGEYCLVDGEIASLDVHAQPIKFQVAMPSRWNEATLQLGGGGREGIVVSPVNQNEVAQPSPVARGYVTFGSDSGHASPSAHPKPAELAALEAALRAKPPNLAPLEAALREETAFALNAEELRNYAGEQLKKTHDAVMFLVKARYGVVPRHSYFVGGSSGGWEAFAVIQQYAEAYDGVVAWMNAGGGFVELGLKLQLIRRAMQLDNGVGAISSAKGESLRQRELAACDALDGLKDSIISNVDGCKFDFRTLRCPGGKDTGNDCFSDAQLATLNVIRSDTRLPYVLTPDQTILFGYPVGSDWPLAAPPIGTPEQFAAGVFATFDSDVRYILLNDPKADGLKFDPLRPRGNLARIQAAARLLDHASVNIDKFAARGGKLILANGLADPAASATAMIDYYKRLIARYGPERSKDFLRFYLVPGYGHAGGIFKANEGATFDAIEAWVERGIAPETLLVTDARAEAHGRSRPMCVYPAWAKYRGSGDVNLATSFSCVTE